jgi:hypothetical protein
MNAWACPHENVVPVDEFLTDEVVARLCIDCGAQLAADWRPGDPATSPPDLEPQRGGVLTDRGMQAILGGELGDVRMAVLTGAGVEGLDDERVRRLATVADLDALPDVDVLAERRAVIGPGTWVSFASARIQAEGVAIYSRAPSGDRVSTLLTVSWGQRHGFPVDMRDGMTVHIPAEGWYRVSSR